jgi:hypothetical protein
MSQPWYHDQRMLAAGNARRRPAGEHDLPQPGSAQSMPAAPSGAFSASREIDRLRGEAAGRAFTEAFLAEAARFGLDPLRLAYLYALAYARPQHVLPPRKPSLFARLFSRKDH